MLTLNNKYTLAKSIYYEIGSVYFEEIFIPVGVLEAIVYVSREGWQDLGPSTPVIKLELWFSFNAGNTWLKGNSSEHAGGIWFDRHNIVMSECILRCHGIPEESSNNRKVKVVITNYIPLKSEISLELRDYISI